MKKHIANIITGSRAIFSLPLLFVPLSSVWFYVLYLFCGVTDMIDGIIARKTGAVSEFGARLDTVADFVFLSAFLAKFLPMVPIPQWLWVWIAVIGVVKIGNLIWGYVRIKTLVSLHTVMNKITGLLLFLLPLSMTFVETTYSVATVCVLATVAVMQEVYLIVNGQEVV